MPRRYLQLIVFLSIALLSGSAIAMFKDRSLAITLEAYAAAIRWGDMAAAQGFLDPKYRELHPLSSLDTERYHQVQVSAYNEQPLQAVSKTEIRQTVEIGLVNKNTQSARTIIDHQVWRYDPEAKHWWLISGLPDISHRD